MRCMKLFLAYHKLDGPSTACSRKWCLHHRAILPTKTEAIFKIKLWLLTINRFSEYHDYKLFFIYMYDPWIFDHMTLKSNKFIGSARYIHFLSLIVIHLSVLMRIHSQAIFAYMSPMTFHLVTPKSNQFIGFARYIHDISLAGIHQSVLEITRSQAVFAYKMSPVTFDLWPFDPKI